MQATQIQQFSNITEVMLPADLDAVLRDRIAKWRKRSGNSYIKLERRLKAFVEEQYQQLQGAVLSDKALEHHLAMHCPKKSYLNQYANGHAMCYRYTNTLANFFGVNYSLSNFDPAQDLQRSLQLQDVARDQSAT